MLFSVVVPVLHESNLINSTICHLRSIAGRELLEIIVVDGSSGQDTLRAVTDRQVITVCSLPGRGKQMNTGASVAHGEVLVFLHADTHLPENAFDEIADAIQKGSKAGAFDLSFDSDKLFLRFIAFTATLRSRFTRVPYGDQVIFIERNYFQKLGGFRDIPCMEDVDVMRRIKRSGGKINIIRNKVITSARRWEQKGMIATTFRNHFIRLLYSWGVSPEKLAKIRS